jgi:hypothetical protein
LYHNKLKEVGNLYNLFDIYARLNVWVTKIFNLAYYYLLHKTKIGYETFYRIILKFGAHLEPVAYASVRTNGLNGAPVSDIISSYHICTATDFTAHQQGDKC